MLSRERCSKAVMCTREGALTMPRQKSNEQRISSLTYLTDTTREGKHGKIHAR